MFLSYPNNPSSAIANVEYFDRAIAFAKKHDLLIVHDNAYSEIGFDGYSRPELPRAPRRQGRRHRAVQLLEGVQHDRLACRVRLRQREGDQGARHREVQHRLRRLHRRPGRRHRGDARPAGRRSPRCARCTSAAATSSWTRSARSASRRASRRAPSTCGRRFPRATPRREFAATHPRGGQRHRRRLATAYGPDGEGYIRISLATPDDRLVEAARAHQERHSRKRGHTSA